MINIVIKNSDVSNEAPDSAIAQLEAHETITGVKGVGPEEGTLFSVPFHAIDHVTVERTPITPVTPSDDLCGDAVEDCSLPAPLVVMDSNSNVINCNYPYYALVGSEYNNNIRLVYDSTGPDETPPEFTLSSDNDLFVASVWFNDEGPWYQGMIVAQNASVGDTANITLTVPSTGDSFTFKATAVE